MESPDLNTPSEGAPDEATLEAFLRQASPPLPDDGFSARVVAALPPPRTTLRVRRMVILSGAGLAGVILAARHLAEFGGMSAVAAGFDLALDQAGTSLLHNSGMLASPAFALAVATTLGSLLYAFRAELRRLA